MAIAKLFAFGLICSGYVLHAGFLLCLHRHQRLPIVMQRYARLLLKLLGIQINFQGHDVNRQTTYFIVGNHVSYLDVLLVSALLPASFVTSVEIKHTPFLGHLCRLAHCVFVERRNRSQLGREVASLAERLRLKQNVVVFPEATSTNAEQVLRFKRPLFRAALQTQTPILPLTINYLQVSGQPASTDNRDIFCWYGEMSFFPHFWKLLTTREIQAEIIVHEPIYTDNYSKDSDPTEISQLAHQIVSSKHRSLTSQETTKSAITTSLNPGVYHV